MNHTTEPTPDTDKSNLSTGDQQKGSAQRPGDTLDRGEPNAETIPRKSSLLPD